MNGGALFNAEFGIRHRGSTVPERSGVALSFCRRLDQSNMPSTVFQAVAQYRIHRSDTTTSSQ
ncbi:hypothetical protein IPC1511_33160 [Pseudomonas aeruginosa]|nr:hypothetical protein IPC1511_33160 [Pseudomonas aeruginosa]TED94946.1 hypothetical protein IPC1510_30485 [Pseudomonas aeruginosa]